MSDYIRREDAAGEVEFGITLASAINIVTGERTELFQRENDELRDAVKRIEALPAANVVPVRLGEWLDGYKMQTCSLCKCKGKKSWTFCPHCGARMIYGKREE